MLIFHIDFNFTNLRPDYLREWISRLAGMGYDTLLWELEDKVRWESCRCVAPEAMTKETLRELLQHARSLGMQNIPLLQTIGHAEYVLKRKQYMRWREDPDFIDCYCTSNPRVKTFLKRWIQEYIDLFGDLNYFHLGGDEAYRFGSCPTCRQIADTRGRNALYADHITDLAQPLLEAGIRPGIWCDMVLHHPDEMAAIPDSFVIWDWNYWDGIDSPEQARIWGQGLISPAELTEEQKLAWPTIVDADGRLVPFNTSDFLQQQGRDVIICSASRSYGDSASCGRHSVHAPNVAGAAIKAANAGMLGTCVTSWAIRLHNYETQYAWLALAARAWQHPHESYDELLVATADACFGLEGTAIFDAFEAIGTPLPMTVTRDIGIQFDNLKNPVVAPPDYLENRFVEWRKNGQLTPLRQRLKDGLEEVQRGTAELERLTKLATRGHRELKAWSAAASYQHSMGILGGALLADEAGEAINRAHYVRLAAIQRLAYRGWLEDWLTRKSADRISSIIHMPALQYLQREPPENR